MMTRNKRGVEPYAWTVTKNRCRSSFDAESLCTDFMKRLICFTHDQYPTNRNEPEKSLDSGDGNTAETRSCGELWRAMTRWWKAVGESPLRFDGWNCVFFGRRLIQNEMLFFFSSRRMMIASAGMQFYPRKNLRG